MLNVGGDGNCFTRSYAYLLFQKQDLYQTVKSSFKAWFVTALLTKPIISIELTANGFWEDTKRTDKILTWCDTHRGDGAWPDNAEELILLFEVQLQRSIQVYSVWNGVFTVSCAGNKTGYPGDTLYLPYKGHLTFAHYNPLVRVS